MSRCYCSPDRWKNKREIASAGSWYLVGYCRTCKKQSDMYLRKVDQRNERDCLYADMSQGIA